MNKNIRGIYKIINIITNKVYIGESLDIERRWNEHREDLNSNQHHSYKLQQDWNEFGADSFKFEVIARLDDNIKNFIDKYILIIYESYYIKQFDSIDKGYNIEDTLEKILIGDKIIFNNRDKYAIEGWQYRTEQNKLVNQDGLIFTKKYYGLKDLRNKIGIRKPKVVENFLFDKVVIKSKINKYKYDLLDEYKDSDDIFLNCESLSSIRLTENGLEYLYNLFNNYIKETN